VKEETGATSTGPNTTESGAHSPSLVTRMKAELAVKTVEQG
jgi:hypothetical protein